jgi:hypothetical protein
MKLKILVIAILLSLTLNVHHKKSQFRKGRVTQVFPLPGVVGNNEI